jgi:hypothetical protein
MESLRDKTIGHDIWDHKHTQEEEHSTLDMTTHTRGCVLDHASMMMQEESFNHGHWKPVGTRRPQ